MYLLDFSLMSPVLQTEEVLKAIEAAIPAAAIEKAIATTQAQEERKRALPAQLMVCVVIAMSLWSRDSMRDVLKNLLDGLSEAWVLVGKSWRFPMFISNYAGKTKIRTPSHEPTIRSDSAANGNNRRP